MNYIIDGHNLISKTPGLSLSMPDDEQRLIELLTQFGRQGRHRMEVFFDGAPPGQAGVVNYGRVRAHFVPAIQTADEAIRSRLIKLGRAARNWMVVSSDHAVQASAHGARSQVMSAEDFTSLLLGALQRGTKKTDTSPDEPLSEAEVKEWLAIFKERGRRK